MNEHASMPSAPVARPMAQRPIWTPDPGVPLVARILSYFFGFLVVITIFRSCTFERPPDLPVMPGKWQTYRTPQGMSIAYPDTWTVNDRSQNGQPDYFFSLSNSVYIEACVVESSYPLASNDDAAFDERVEAELQKDIPGYTAQGIDARSGWHRFTTSNPSSQQKTPLQGAWTSRIQGNDAACLIAVSPSEGWPEMEQIFSYVLTNFTMG